MSLTQTPQAFTFYIICSIILSNGLLVYIYTYIIIIIISFFSEPCERCRYEVPLSFGTSECVFLKTRTLSFLPTVLSQIQEININVIL